MKLRIHDTRAKRKVDFSPWSPGASVSTSAVSRSTTSATSVTRAPRSRST